MPAMFKGGAGFRNKINEAPTTKTRLPHDNTAYVNGVTCANTLKAAAACSHASTPSNRSNPAERGERGCVSNAVPSLHAQTGKNMTAASALNAAKTLSGDQPALASNLFEYKCCSERSAAAARAENKPAASKCISVADARPTPAAMSMSDVATPRGCRSPKSSHARPAVHRGVVAFTVCA